MKTQVKIFAVCFAALAAGTFAGAAQSLKVSEQGETVRDGRKVYVIPSTTIAIDLTVRHESIRVGEYARYAQSNLGVIAPLADKDIYTIESASIGWTDSDTPAEAIVNAIPAGSFTTVFHIEPPGADFMRVPPDRVSFPKGMGAADAAREAATTIYDIRKARLSLLMEPVEGMDAALEGLDRAENRYLELFLGKQSVETYTVRFYVVPQRGQSTYIICRMNDFAGILPTEDLSGEPIILELRPKGLVAAAVSDANKSKKKSSGGSYVVADMVSCTVTDGNRNFAAAVIPVYQLGATVPM